tara:strand:+ start:396 stop:812 length:417 start_codon:yes stop_codon:yes gene_type:complete
MLTKVIMVLFIISFSFTQKFGEWRWADDTSEFTMDKEAHFVGSSGAYFFFRHKDYTIKESVLYTFYLGLGKECIDAILPWEKYGRWGGDGFSKYDLAYNVAGIGLAVLIDSLWRPKNKINYISVSPKSINIGLTVTVL